MKPTLSLFAFLIFSLPACLQAQYVGIVEPANQTQREQPKIENGLIISWPRGILGDPAADQVELFDEHSMRRVVGINVLRPMEWAQSVSIDQVAARANLIVVSAVYESKDGNEHTPAAAALLVFDLRGKLVSAIACRDEILQLAFDDKQNVWALTDAGDGRTTVDPRILEYTIEGKVVREWKLREVFPLSAELRLDGERNLTNWTTMQFDKATLWVWLSGSTDLISISTNDGKVSKHTTNLPIRAGYSETQLSPVLREHSGDMIAEFREDGPLGVSQIKYYRWSLSQRSWTQFTPGACAGERLVGVDDAGQIYATEKFGKTDICAFGP